MRSFPRALAYAPKKYQGLGITNLYVKQASKHIQKILKFGKSSTLTGQLIRCTVEQLKLETGLPGPALGQNFRTAGLLATNSWIKETWKYLASHGMEIRDTTDDPALRCKNDKPIIPMLIAGGYKGTELRILNLCRLYLKAYSIADLVTADGLHISQGAWQGNAIECTGRARLDWPRQGRPKEAEWEQWRKALTKGYT